MFDPKETRDQSRKISHYDNLRKEQRRVVKEEDPFNPHPSRPERAFTPNKSLFGYRDSWIDQGDFYRHNPPRDDIQSRHPGTNRDSYGDDQHIQSTQGFQSNPFHIPKRALSSQTNRQSHRPLSDLPPHGNLSANQKRSYLEAFNVIGDSKPLPTSLYVSDTPLLGNHLNLDTVGTDPIIDSPTMETVKTMAVEACRNLWKGTSLLYFALRASVSFAYNAMANPEGHNPRPGFPALPTSETKRRKVSSTLGNIGESDIQVNDMLFQNALSQGVDVELEIVGSRQVRESVPERVPGAFIDQYEDYYARVAPEQMREARAGEPKAPPPAHLRRSNQVNLSHISNDDSINFNGSFAASSPHFKPSRLLDEEFATSIGDPNQSFTPMILPKRSEPRIDVSHASRVPSYGTTFLQRPLDSPLKAPGEQSRAQKFTVRLYNAFSGNYKPPPTVVPESSFTDAPSLESQNRTESLFSAWGKKVHHDEKDLAEIDARLAQTKATLYQQQQADLDKSVDRSRVYHENYEAIEARRADIQAQIDRQRSLTAPLKKKSQPILLDLSPAQLDQVDQLWSSSPSHLVIDKFRIDLHGRDLQTLRDGRWLNDNVINFYLSLVTERFQQSSGRLPRVACMITQFFTTLEQKGYQGVARWAKRGKIDVVESDLVFVPLNLNGNHWCLAVVDNINKELRQHDSLGGDGTHNLLLIRDYLRQEAEKQHPGSGDMFDSYSMIPRAACPQQNNGWDCGVFTCQNVELMSRDAPLSYSQGDMPKVRRRIVYELSTASFLSEGKGKL